MPEQAVERYVPPKTVIATLSDARFKIELAKALPPQLSVDEVLRVARTEVMANETLQKCTPETFLRAMLRSAAVGLRIGILGEAWLIARWNRNALGSGKGAYEATFQAGAQGVVKLARNTSVGVPHGVVWPEDDFEWMGGTNMWVHHKPALDANHKDQHRIVAFWAASLDIPSGRIYDVVVMSQQDVIDWRDRYAGRNKDGKINGIWLFPDEDAKGQFEAMGVKTVIMRALKWAPKSPELESVTRDWHSAEPAPEFDVDGTAEALPPAPPAKPVTARQLTKLTKEMERVGMAKASVDAWHQNAGHAVPDELKDITRDNYEALMLLLAEMETKAPKPETTEDPADTEDLGSETDDADEGFEVVEGEATEVPPNDLPEAERHFREMIWARMVDGKVPAMMIEAYIDATFSVQSIYELANEQVTELCEWVAAEGKKSEGGEAS